MPAPNHNPYRHTSSRPATLPIFAGNHNPAPPSELGGRIAGETTVGDRTCCHGPVAEAGAGEISGHLHPKASVAVRVRTVTARCFVTDGRRMVMPAFGAFTGGLDVHDERSEEHTSELQSLMRISYAVFCLKKKMTYNTYCINKYV